MTTEGKQAVIAFYTDVEEQARDEREGKITCYTAECWTMSVPAQPGLEARVRAHSEMWLAKIKTVTEAEEAAARLKELERTATDDAVCELAEIVADLMDGVTELAEMIAGM